MVIFTNFYKQLKQLPFNFRDTCILVGVERTIQDFSNIYDDAAKTQCASSFFQVISDELNLRNAFSFIPLANYQLILIIKPAVCYFSRNQILEIGCVIIYS